MSDVFIYVDEDGVERISAPAHSHSVVSRKQSDAYREIKDAAKWREGRQPSFTASNMRNLHEVYDRLTTAQCGYLMRLQCNVDFEDGALVNANGSPMTKNDIRDMLGLEKKRQTFYDFYNACIEAGVIIEQDELLRINTRYHFKGAFSDPYVVKSYTAMIKRVYKAVKVADIGLVYRMLPFVHYETNVLCANPHETNPNMLNFLDRAGLAEVLGISPTEVSRRIKNITFDGKFVIAQIKVGKATKFMVNPWVIYRKNSEPDATLQTIFAVRK